MRFLDKQLDAMSPASSQSFADAMVAQLVSAYPTQCGALTMGQLHELVQDGVERAAGYGFIASRHVYRFINLMFIFGDAFDMSPQHGWAAGVLHDPNIVEPEERIERLVAAGREHLRALQHAER